jgi:tartrate dehydratase beta subunit/fumarate hydratase class I family protein
MDPFTPPLVAAGVRMFIGKGPRSPMIASSLAAAGAVYLAAAGGTAALGGGCVDSCTVAGWEDLGSEALYRIVLRDYPVFVALDLHGGNLFEMRMRK